jgi:hypothetical protein
MIPFCPADFWDRVIKEVAIRIMEAERQTGAAPHAQPRPQVLTGGSRGSGTDGAA